ncbi:MgtC/SapB family protein [Guptibacillus algicola]|uniref:MgtC/SapB family protein n=1 Tax=Guptibacillus algicola TaxID=225844 RepID=UPI001CD2175E|nr:MgtC/SapB family protein [Alkalihalobacillus algicola]MCA0989477.1 MgtC/SapB family protein [Alkalihalobacillus algicola]
MEVLNITLDDNFVTISLRILIAAILSGVIGMEREFKRHPAGFRTHILVGVGACLMMLLSLFGFEEYNQTHANINFDPSRIPSYVISGIGFLGAGTILANGWTVRGLTTAASIWIVAGIGLVVGVGMLYEAILTTLIVVLSLVFLSKVEKLYMSKSQHWINLFVEEGLSLTSVIEKMEEMNISVLEMKTDDPKDTHYEENKRIYTYSILVNTNNSMKLSTLVDHLKEIDKIKRINCKE